MTYDDASPRVTFEFLTDRRVRYSRHGTTPVETGRDRSAILVAALWDRPSPN